jgi:hypothetical protein
MNCPYPASCHGEPASAQNVACLQSIWRSGAELVTGHELPLWDIGDPEFAVRALVWSRSQRAARSSRSAAPGGLSQPLGRR